MRPAAIIVATLAGLGVELWAVAEYGSPHFLGVRDGGKCHVVRQHFERLKGAGSNRFE